MAVTVRLTGVVLGVRPVAVPVIVIVAAPDVAAVVGSVAIVSVEVPLPPVTVAGTNEQVAPAGRPAEQVRATSSVNPFTGVIVTVDVALFPAVMLLGLGALAAMPKPGIGAVTVRVMVVVLVSVPSVPDTVTVDTEAGVLDVVEIVNTEVPLPPVTGLVANEQVASSSNMVLFLFLCFIRRIVWSGYAFSHALNHGGVEPVQASEKGGMLAVRGTHAHGIFLTPSQ